MTIPNNDSLYKGFIRFPTDTFEEAQPLDAATVREGIINNLESLYNGAMQIRANVVLTSSVNSNDSNDPLFSPEESLTFFRTIGPFPVTVLKNGELAPLYIEIAAAGSDASETRLTISLKRANDAARRRFPRDPFVHEGYVTLTGSTVYWHKLTYPNDSLLNLQPHSFAPDRRIRTRLTSSEATPSHVPEIVLCQLDLYGSIAAGSSATHIKFGGIYVRENPWRIR